MFSKQPQRPTVCRVLPGQTYCSPAERTEDRGGEAGTHSEVLEDSPHVWKGSAPPGGAPKTPKLAYCPSGFWTSVVGDGLLWGQEVPSDLPEAAGVVVLKARIK